MSSRERAQKCAVEAAFSLRSEASRIGMLRSVDATEAAKWLNDMADEIFTAADRPEMTVAAQREAFRAARSKPADSTPAPSDRALRQKLSKARAAGRIGRKS